MKTVRDWFIQIYVYASDRPPLARGAAGIVVAVLLAIGGINIATQLEHAGSGVTPAAIVFWEATSIASAIATFFLLVGPVLRGVHRSALHTPARCATLAGLSVISAIVHIASFKLMRAGGAALLGPAFACPLFGNLPFEFTKDFVFLGCFMFGLFVAPASLRRGIFETPEPTVPPAPILVQSTPDLLDLPDGRNRQRLRSGEIIAVNSAGNYAEFRLLDGRRPLLRSTLALLETQLATRGFLRVHRSWIVNPTHVRRIQARPPGDFRLTLVNGEIIPASRRYEEALAAVMAAGKPLGGKIDEETPRSQTVHERKRDGRQTLHEQMDRAPQTRH